MSLIQISLKASVLILVVILLRCIPSQHLSKQAIMYMWKIAVLRLLVPLEIPFRWSIFSIIDNLYERPYVTSIQVRLLEMPTLPSSVKTFETEFPILQLIYLTGFSILFFGFLLLYIRSLCCFKDSKQSESPSALEWQKALRLKRSVTIRVCKYITTPLTYGSIRPIILLPEGIDYLDLSQLRFILTHELIHIRRFDSLCKLLMFIALCIHWFNPLVWVMLVIMNRDIESACDEAVIRTYGTLAKSNYVSMLIKMEEAKLIVVPLINHFSQYAIQERVHTIMRFRKASAIGIALTFSTVCCSVLVFATSSNVPTVNYQEDKQLSYYEDIEKVISVPVHYEEDQPEIISDKDSISSDTFTIPLHDRSWQEAFDKRQGIAFYAPKGTPVYPIQSGVVVEVVDQFYSLGKHIIIEHENGYQSIYGHNDKMFVSVGDSVTSEDVIAEVGRTGLAPDYMLYIEMRYNEELVEIPIQ